MPELPEVETLRRGLEQSVLNRRITGVLVANAKVLKGQAEETFHERVIGKYITGVDRRGKYLLVRLSVSSTDTPTSPSPASPHGSSPLLLCIHLKMRGQLRVCSSNGTRGSGGGDDAAKETIATEVTSPYLCVRLELDKGATELWFEDMWTWGEMRALTEDEARLLPGLAKMGAEPLEPGWDGTALASKLSGRKGPIKPVLLDQTVVAGVGNIYADEALFRAGIHPERSAQSLLAAETNRLADEIRAVLTEAVNGGGTTSDNYFDIAGSPGRYAPRVYDRGGEPCVVCGTVLIRIRLGGRGTVFCTACQS